MVSQLDPYTIEHVNKLVCDNYNSGELNISLPDSDNTIYGWWHLGNSTPGPKAYPNSLTFSVEDIDSLQNAYDKFNCQDKISIDECMEELFNCS